MNRVQRFGAVARDHTGSGGYEAIEREEAALISSWEQWERGALQTRARLETTLFQITNSEQEFNRRCTQLEQDLQALSQQLQDCHVRLSQAERKNNGEEAVKAWQIAKVGHVFQYRVRLRSIKSHHLFDVTSDSRGGLNYVWLRWWSNIKCILRLLIFVNCVI